VLDCNEQTDEQIMYWA